VHDLNNHDPERGEGVDLVDETLLEGDGVVVVRVGLAAAVRRPLSPAPAYFLSDPPCKTGRGACE
jgi:hypothetical protein